MAGASRVQVSPELIEVATSSAKWQQPFDAALTDVFQVQADIAAKWRVLSMWPWSTVPVTSSRPSPPKTSRRTTPILRGEQIFVTRGLNDPVSLRRALAYYQQAVALDSTFALAWARIGRAQALLYANGVPDPAVGELSRRAAERAFAIDPNLPDSRNALAGYYMNVRNDAQRAREEYEALLD